MKQSRTMVRMPGHCSSKYKRLASMSPRPSRMTHQASLQQSQRSLLMPDFRPTLAIPCSIAGGHLKTSLLSSRRKVKASGAEQNDEHLLALAKQLWQWRWSLLKKPAPISEEETQAIAARERADAECIPSFRSSIRQLVPIFDQAHSEAQTETAAPGYPSS